MGGADEQAQALVDSPGKRTTKHRITRAGLKACWLPPHVNTQAPARAHLHFVHAAADQEAGGARQHAPPAAPLRRRLAVRRCRLHPGARNEALL